MIFKIYICIYIMDHAETQDSNSKLEDQTEITTDVKKRKEKNKKS